MPVMQRQFDFALFEKYSQMKNDPRYNKPGFQLKQFDYVPVEHIETDHDFSFERLSIQKRTFIYQAGFR